MTRVLIVSDSHGLSRELMEIKTRHQVDYHIHCGDSELEYHSEPLQGYYKVRGNCDFDRNFPEEEIIQLDGMKFLVVHGHLHGVKFGHGTLIARAKEVDADVVCYGHTHIALATKEDNHLIINPGSIVYPRGSFPEKTYAILEWEKRDELRVNFFTVDGNNCGTLDYTTSLA